MSGKLGRRTFSRPWAWPEGVVSVVIGDSSSGQALLEADIRQVTFTGSVSVGRHVAKVLREHVSFLARWSSGGKDRRCSSVPTPNLDNARGGAVVGMLHQHRTILLRTERVYVNRVGGGGVHAKVVRGYRSYDRAVEGDFDVGALFTTDQLEIVEHHVATRVAKAPRCWWAPPQSKPQGSVLRAHRPRERESRHAGDDGRDVRAGVADHAGEERGRGRTVRER